ncbi:MAG: EscU/YscU/HrcU family type III secretion system export apparatus switch protein, partial [Planctomycetota bacterium]
MSLSEDKIHKPSSKRLRNAAENGQFPYSSDLAVALALLTGCILVSLNAQNLTDKFVGFYRDFYSTSFAELTDVQTVMNDLPMLILGFVAPLALTVWFISLVVSWIQSPKVARKNAFSDPSANWNPANRWEQLVSVTTPLRLLFQLVRMAAVVGIAWYGLLQLVDVSGNATAGSPQVTASEAFAIYPGVLIQICMVRFMSGLPVSCL